MKTPHAPSATPETLHNAYLPMHADRLEFESPEHYEQLTKEEEEARARHYQRMEEVAEALVDNDAQAVYDAALKEEDFYVALADVCDDASRNPGAPGAVKVASAYLLDRPVARNNQYNNVQTGPLFNYDTYTTEQLKAINASRMTSDKDRQDALKDRPNPESYNRDPAVREEVEKAFQRIQFYSRHLSGNPRFGEYYRKYEQFEAANIPANLDPDARTALLNEKLAADPELRKWYQGAKEYQQCEDRINKAIGILAEIVDNNRDYGKLAEKKLEVIFGQEGSTLRAYDKARHSEAASIAHFRDAAERRSVVGRAAGEHDHRVDQLGRRVDHTQNQVAEAERKLQEARQNQADEDTLNDLQSKLDGARYQAAAAQHDLSSALSISKDYTYDKLEFSAQQGRAKAGADAAKGHIEVTRIVHQEVSDLARIMRENIDAGTLRLNYEISDEERAEHSKFKAQLESMVHKAVQRQHANNTVEQEHELFTVRHHLQSYIAYIEERLQDADPKKYDPRFPVLIAQRGELVDLEGKLLYNTAAQRLRRAESYPHQPDTLNFKGRPEVVPVADEGLLVKDGTNCVFYPDGSRAYLQSDGTYTKRAFANKPYMPKSHPEQSQPAEGANKTQRQKHVAGRLGKLLRRSPRS